ncbi:ferric reductase-like transmembrane domain-containing protein [Roseibium sp.]|uniref:ferredoxin reductase family protein n=1 Tax=Roseibium sp. TaxID=1936156 RepID=UPI003A976242
MSGRWLIPAYLCLVFLPLALAAFSGRSPRSFLDELGTGAGMIAFSILLAEFLLSGRFRAISGGVGMDVTMRMHQLFARSALAFVIVHPFLYSSPFGWALPFDPTRELTLAQPGIALAAGALAWVLLPAFVLVSIARSDLFKRYENWRLGHGLGAALIAGASWYHATEAGRYSADPAVYWFWTASLIVALFSLVSVYVVRPLFQSLRPWRVTTVEKVADRTWSVELAPEGHDGMTYKAGQFVWLNIGHSAFSLAENPFSLASAPAGKAGLGFVIKELGDFTSTLDQVAEGTRAYVDGPFGHLSIDGINAPGIALVAGGVGIAPMLSILRQLQAAGDQRPVSLLYGNRHAGQIVAEEELERWAETPEHELVHVLSEPEENWSGETGLLSSDLIERYYGRPERRDWVYVLCGPPDMMTSVEETLLDLGVPGDHILSERFSYD